MFNELVSPKLVKNIRTKSTWFFLFHELVVCYKMQKTTGWYRVNLPMISVNFLYFLYLLEWLDSTKTNCYTENLGPHRIYVHMRFVLSSCYFLGFPLTNRLPIEVPSNCWLKHSRYMKRKQKATYWAFTSKTMNNDTLYPAQTQCNCESWKLNKKNRSH